MTASTHRVGFALGITGVLAVLGGFLLPESRTVLFVLGATGIYIGILLPYLAAEPTVPASVLSGVYEVLIENVARLGDGIDPDSTEVYIPSVSDGPGGDRPVSLLAARNGDGTSSKRPPTVFLVAGADGDVVLSPIGTPLVREFERSLSAELSDDPEELLTQLLDGLVEGFELVDHATATVDSETSRAWIDVSGSVCGPIDRFDHPVASFLGVGLARGLDRLIIVRTETTADDGSAYRLTCSWSEVTLSRDIRPTLQKT